MTPRRTTAVKKKNYNVIYDLSDPDPPKKHERHAAKIVAEYFESDLIFIRKGFGTTPDLKIIKTNQIWELKSPLGNGKRTMANNLREASGQSKNIILDLTRCKMNNHKALSRIRSFLKSGDAHIKKLLVIDKSGKILDFLSKKR